MLYMLFAKLIINYYKYNIKFSNITTKFMGLSSGNWSHQENGTDINTKQTQGLRLSRFLQTVPFGSQRGVFHSKLEQECLC